MWSITVHGKMEIKRWNLTLIFLVKGNISNYAILLQVLCNSIIVSPNIYPCGIIDLATFLVQDILKMIKITVIFLPTFLSTFLNYFFWNISLKKLLKMVGSTEESVQLEIDAMFFCFMVYKYLRPQWNMIICENFSKCSPSM